ncbi:hypothetical protein PV762_13115 [Mitsuaria sp. CC2]|uniref:hypothetical protein n=1 Tax=Mitsuaria sp. CC2 TaxID=3029186 RepID=UPI003B8DB403
MDNSSDTTPQSSATPTPVKGSVVSQRRRRFIQAGVVPVGLTLASRPAMAWHCNSTSAWGSAILRDGGASVKARAAAAVISNTECWNVSNWINNSVRGQVSSSTPWSFVSTQLFRSKGDDYAKKNLLIKHVFPSGHWKFGKDVKVMKAFETDGASGIGTLVLVARLNAMFAGHRVAECVLSNGTDMLQKMASSGPGMFKPTNSTGSAWIEKDFRQYLTDNYLAMP